MKVKNILLAQFAGILGGQERKHTLVLTPKSLMYDGPWTIFFTSGVCPATLSGTRHRGREVWPPGQHLPRQQLQLSSLHHCHPGPVSNAQVTPSLTILYSTQHSESCILGIHLSWPIVKADKKRIGLWKKSLNVLLFTYKGNRCTL